MTQVRTGADIEPCDYGRKTNNKANFSKTLYHMPANAHAS